MEKEFRGKIKASLLKRAACAALEITLTSLEKNVVEVSLYITDETGIIALNKKYRKKDRPTDVLSFPFSEKRGREETSFISPPGSPQHLGEVVLCYPYIHTQAEREGQLLPQAIAWTTIHGVLHLLGRKHRTRDEKQIMQTEEKRALLLLRNSGY